MFHSTAAFADAALPFDQGEMAAVAPLTLGPALRQAREAMKLSLEDIAATTRISLRYLIAIEESRFDAFVGAVYALGFVRAYARMVGMCEKSAAATLRSEAGWA